MHKAVAGYQGPSSQESNHVLEISRHFTFYVLLPSCLEDRFVHSKSWRDATPVWVQVLHQSLSILT